MPIFYEEEHVKALLNGSKNNEYISTYELGLIACYFRHNLKMSMDQTEESLLDFCTDNNDDFNKILSRNKIKKAINMPTYRKLRKRINPVVYGNEMDIIFNTFDNHKVQGATFASLTYAKFFGDKDHFINDKFKNNQDKKYTVSLSMAQMLRLSKINVDKKTRFQIIHEVHQSGLVTFNIGRNNQGFYEVNFVDEIGVPQIIITDLYDLSKFFPYICDNCGKTYNKKSGQRHQLCEECYQEKRKKDIKNNVRKLRNK